MGDYILDFTLNGKELTSYPGKRRDFFNTYIIHVFTGTPYYTVLYSVEDCGWGEGMERWDVFRGSKYELIDHEWVEVKGDHKRRVIEALMHLDYLAIL